MKKAVIHYFDGSKQVISPTQQFKGDWKGLIDTVTKSDSENRTYRNFEII